VQAPSEATDAVKPGAIRIVQPNVEFLGIVPRRMPRKRIANPRIVANSADIVLNAFTFAAWGSVSSSRGLIHSAAATIGETNCPVVGSLSMALVHSTGPGMVGCSPLSGANCVLWKLG
jgi:hypothetical protein